MMIMEYARPLRGIWWFVGLRLIGAIIVFLVFAGLLLFIVRLAFWGTWRAHRGPWRYRDEALETLRTKYARGEITKEQYLETKKVLEER